MPGKLTRQKWITRQDLQSNPQTFYVFGDNLLRQGYGGQAKSMRGEPNAIGVPTKRAPGMRDKDFFTDADWGGINFRNILSPREIIESEFDRIKYMLNSGYDVVIPEDGLGTGLSELPRRAPIIHAWIEDKIAELVLVYGTP